MNYAKMTYGNKIFKNSYSIKKNKRVLSIDAKKHAAIFANIDLKPN